MAENNDRYVHFCLFVTYSCIPMSKWSPILCPLCVVGTFSMILGGITPEPEMASKPGIQDRMYFPTDWSNELPLIFNIWFKIDFSHMLQHTIFFLSPKKCLLKKIIRQVISLQRQACKDIAVILRVFFFTDTCLRQRTCQSHSTVNIGLWIY